MYLSYKRENNPGEKKIVESQFRLYFEIRKQDRDIHISNIRGGGDFFSLGGPALFRK